MAPPTYPIAAGKYKYPPQTLSRATRPGLQAAARAAQEKRLLDSFGWSRREGLEPVKTSLKVQAEFPGVVGDAERRQNEMRQRPGRSAGEKRWRGRQEASAGKVTQKTPTSMPENNRRWQRRSISGEGGARVERAGKSCAQIVLARAAQEKRLQLRHLIFANEVARALSRRNRRPSLCGVVGCFPAYFLAFLGYLVGQHFLATLHRRSSPALLHGVRHISAYPSFGTRTPYNPGENSACTFNFVLTQPCCKLLAWQNQSLRTGLQKR